MIKYHTTSTGDKAAELLPESAMQLTPEDILNQMAEAYFTGCDKIVIRATSLPSAFFDLNKRIAGEVLQKLSNFKMKLAIIGHLI